jgi:hypothetical protein
MADFMSCEKDRVISFFCDAQGAVSFQVMTRSQPLEFDGLQPLYWRKIFRSETYPDNAAAFAAAREQFAWVEASWLADM